MLSSNQEYLTLRNRLYRQLDSYGLRKKGKENRHYQLKKTKSSQCTFTETQPVHHSNNLILQICLEASMANPSPVQILKQQIGQQNFTKKDSVHSRTRSSRMNFRHSQTKSLGKKRSVTSQNKSTILSNQSVYQSSFQTRKPIVSSSSTINKRHWVPPSIAIGIIAPKAIPISQLSVLTNKKRVQTPRNKNYQALQDLNKKITDMWKHWNIKMQRGKKLRKNNI